MTRQDERLRLVRTIKDALLKAYELEAVILFGSLGRGDGDEFSDVDLLLVMDTGGNAENLVNEMTCHVAYLAQDIHKQVVALEPGMDQDYPWIAELNSYFPEKPGRDGVREMIENTTKTQKWIRGVIARYPYPKEYNHENQGRRIAKI